MFGKGEKNDNSTFFLTRFLQICLCKLKRYSFFTQLKFDVAFCFCVCLWANILKVTFSHFIGAACIQLEYLLTVHPHPVAINQALRYDIQHKLVTGLAGAEESDASREQLLLVLSACEKRFLRLR